MNSKQYNLFRHLLGYALGICLIVGVAYGIIYLSSIDFAIFNIPIITNNTIRIIISIPVFLLGIIFAIWSNVALLSKGKGGPLDIVGVSISPRTKKLVIKGPYQYTRNPMAFGALSIFLSVVIYFNSLGCLILLIIFSLIFVKLVIANEEKRLLNDFGEDYLKYKKATSMIFPLPKRKKKVL